MKKTFRKAMLSTMAMLLVGVMSLTGVTYAWFTQSETADVENFDVTVKDSTGGALMISLKPGTDNYFNFTDKVTPDIDPGDLAPVSTAGNLSSSGAIEFFSATIANSKQIKNSVVASATNYKTFDLYFYNPGADEFKVQLNSLNISPRVDDPDTEKDESGDANASQLFTRVAFVAFEGVAYDGLNSKNDGYNGAWAYNKDTTKVTIFEPHSTTHNTYGELEQGANISGVAETGVKYPYYGLIGTTSDETPFNRYGAVENLTKEVKTYDVATEDVEILSVKGQHVVKATVYIWMEGQDVDCVDAVAGYAITGSFQFGKYTAPAASESEPEQGN